MDGEVLCPSLESPQSCSDPPSSLPSALAASSHSEVEKRKRLTDHGSFGRYLLCTGGPTLTNEYRQRVLCP